MVAPKKPSSDCRRWNEPVGYLPLTTLFSMVTVLPCTSTNWACGSVETPVLLTMWTGSGLTSTMIADP